MTEGCHQEGGGTERRERDKSREKEDEIWERWLDSVVLLASFKLGLLRNFKKCKNG